MTPTATQILDEESIDRAVIRPFSVNVPEAELTELRKRINATKWPRTGNGHRCVAGRAARDNSGARPLLGQRSMTGANARQD